MSTKYKNVEIRYTSCLFDIEIDDNELKFAKNCGIDVKNDEELVKFHLENNFDEHQDLLEIDDFDFDVVEDRQ
ncbi:MAG: hypothetical protein HFJ59_03960 [Clostridia bacterium]|nr:hypothetical protein [Clostridia bacterium]